MSYKNIEITKDDKLGICTIKNEKNNSLDFETIDEISDGLLSLESDKNINCLAMIGNNKFFSPGADINQLKDLNSQKAKEKKLFHSLDKLEKINIPLCALVQGYALGGGMELALMCDFIIASKKAKFAQPEINLGLIPGIGGTQRLKKYIGKYNANFLCMTGEMITSEEAKEYGFVSKVIEDSDFINSALEIMHNISSKPKSSLLEIKRLIKLDNKFNENLTEERESFYNLLDGKNKTIGIDAFLNKQKPDWKD